MTAPDTGRRNLLLLVQLRWLAVVGQLVTILIVQFGLSVSLPFTLMLAVLGGLIALNIVQLASERQRPVTDLQLLAALLVDMGSLGIQLYLSGGATNPFLGLFLLQVVLGAVLLSARSAWLLAAVSSVTVAALSHWYHPLPLPPQMQLTIPLPHIAAAWFNFTLTAVLLVLFVTRITRNLQERDARLAAARQRVAEEEHIVRMGLLASGAAHELGTPLASLSVALGDWAREDAVRADPALAGQVAEMRAEVARCKQVLGGVLQAAGEVSGEAPARTTLRTFLGGVADAWSAQHPGRLHVEHSLRDRAIVADRALAQTITNLLDNALEAGADNIRLAASIDGDALDIAVSDDGPGFAQDILASVGQPYRSTKDRRGAGLGLFLATNVLRTLGGSLHAENHGGGRVRLRIPLAALAT